MIASRNELIAEVAAPRTGTEAFTWLLTALVAGSPRRGRRRLAREGGRLASGGPPRRAVAALGGALADARRGTLRPLRATG